MKKFFSRIDKIFFFSLLKIIYQKYLIYKTRRYLQNFSSFKTYNYTSKKNEFSALCEKYLTDKGGLKESFGTRNFHFYSLFYNEYFQNKKNNINLIFECGIGTTDKKIQSNIAEKGKKPGASLRVLRDYFQNAHIYAADIDKNILFEDIRISTMYVNQLDERSIDEMWKKINRENFDLIIDDGLHTLKSVYNLFDKSFSKLKPKGLYVIEDVHISYLRQLSSKLQKFKPTIISSDKKHNVDDYLLVIEKN